MFLVFCGLAGCSNRDGNIGHSPAVRRVAVSYAGAVAGDDERSTGREVTRHVVSRGTSMALGAAGFGWVGEVFSLASIVKGPGKKTKGVTQTFRQQCLLRGADPVVETAKALERRLARDRAYGLDAREPEATFALRVVRADMEPVDSIGQLCRPSLTVRATLVDRSGKILWQRQGSGAGRAHTWREYGNRASLFRSELAAASDAVARSLIAGLK